MHLLRVITFLLLANYPFLLLSFEVLNQHHLPQLFALNCFLDIFGVPFVFVRIYFVKAVGT